VGRIAEKVGQTEQRHVLMNLSQGREDVVTHIDAAKLHAVN
jgi:hypothetical protein